LGATISLSFFFLLGILINSFFGNVYHKIGLLSIGAALLLEASILCFLLIYRLSKTSYQILMILSLIFLPLFEIAHVSVRARSRHSLHRSRTIHWALPQARPNIFIIVIDAVRTDHLSLYGYDRETSPNLSALAKEAVTFEYAMSQSPSTKPSIATLFTSLPPQKHAALHPTDVLSPSLATLASILKSLGYSTACFSANPLISPAFGMTQGFDEYFGFRDPPDESFWGGWAIRNALFFFPKGRDSKPNAILLLLRGWPMLVSKYSSGISSQSQMPQYTSSAKDVLSWFETWMKRTDDKAPVFAYIHFLDPHTPYTPPQEYRSSFGASSHATGTVPDPGAWVLSPFDKAPALEPKVLDDVIKLYDGEIAYADWATGRIFDALRSKSWYENSAIVVTSDHGQEFWEHGNWEHNRSLFEEVLHVPLVFRFPNRALAGQRPGNMARLMDITPTLLDLLGLETPDWMWGTSLLRSLEKNETLPAFAHVDKGPGGWSSSLRTERFKYILAERGQDRFEMLFDLEEDPKEQIDLVGQEETLLDSMREALSLQSIEIQTSDSYKSSQTMDNTAKEALRNLGYLD